MTIVRESFNSQANAATTTPTVNAPSGIVAGNVLVCAISFNGSPGTITPPTGWVELGLEIGASNPRVGLWRKVAGSSEPASYQWSHTTSVASGMVIARYSGVDNSTPEDVAAVGSWSAAATSFSFTGVNIVTAGAMLIVGVGVNSATTIITENSALITEVAEVGGKRCELDDGIQASSGATGTIAFTFSQSRASAAVVVALRPATTGGGITGGGSVTLAEISRAASGGVAIAGNAAQSLAAINRTATGSVGIEGAATTTLDTIARVGIGNVSVSGAAGVTLSGITASASGTVQTQGGITGSANVTLTGITRVASGAVWIGGSGAATLSPLSRTAQGAVRITGAAAKTMGEMVAIGSGAVTVRGLASAILGVMTGGASGTVAVLAALPISTRKVIILLIERVAKFTPDERTVQCAILERIFRISIDNRNLYIGD